MPIPPTVHEISDDLAARIASGEWQPGTKLPPGRELADHYAVSLSTLQRAVSILRSRGALVGRQGRGVYVPEGPA